MIPAEEAEFIRLWQEGASYNVIAQALGCLPGTVASRPGGKAEAVDLTRAGRDRRASPTGSCE
jgi:hypothetical protein